jgi:hypothetical protein
LSEQLIKLSFKGNRREYFENPMDFPIVPGDYLIVETDKGQDLGKVSAVTDTYEPRKSFARQKTRTSKTSDKTGRTRPVFWRKAKRRSKNLAW